MSQAGDLEGPLAVPTPAEEVTELVGAATAAMRLDQLDTAREKLQRVLELDPRHDQGRNLLGLLHYRAGAVDEAERIFLALLQENPGEVALSLNLAVVYLKAEQHRAAHDWLHRVLARHPGHPRAQELLARVEMLLGAAGPDPDVMIPDALPDASSSPEEETRPVPTALGAQGPDEGQVKAAALAALRARNLRSAEPGPKEEATEAARRASREFAFDDGERTQPPVTVTGRTADDLATQSPPEGHLLPAGEGYLDPFAEDGMFIEEFLDDTPIDTAAAEPMTVAASLGNTRSNTGDSSPASGPPEDVPAVADPGGEIDLDLELATHEGLIEGVDDAAAVGQTPEGSVPSTLNPGREIVLDGQLDEVLVAVMAAVRSQGLSSLAGARADESGNDGGPAGANVDVMPLGALPMAEPESDLPALVDDDVLLWPVREVGYLRSGSLLGLRGALELEAVPRRYRGKRTESPFGGDDGAFIVAHGDGVAWLDAGQRAIRVVALDADELYVLERAVLAFSGGLVWDNGRLAEDGHTDIDIVHLSGSGRVALRAAQGLRAIKVQAEPCLVDIARLAGWTGSLTPTRTSLPALSVHTPRRSVVQFEGDGVVLLG